ncbi:MAG TPA: hypothetical protein G4N94_09955 [Caldilineae bacterium]|nr:hypothetical protein [Caldilineae bacterium]
MTIDSEQINFKLTDALWEEMSEFEGVPIASLVVWDSSLVDDRLDDPVTDENRIYVDFELYLDDQRMLELYGVAVLEDETSDALVGLDNIGRALSRLAENGAFIQEIAADQDDSLVLILQDQENKRLLTPVTAWLATTWDALPEETV